MFESIPYATNLCPKAMMSKTYHICKIFYELYYKIYYLNKFLFFISKVFKYK